MRDARATAFQSRMRFLGRARASRANASPARTFGGSPKQSFPAKVRAGEMPAPTRETGALPGTDFVGKLPTNAGWQPALPDQD